MENWEEHGEPVVGDGNEHFYFEKSEDQDRAFFRVLSLDLALAP